MFWKIYNVIDNNEQFIINLKYYYDTTRIKQIKKFEFIKKNVRKFLPVAYVTAIYEIIRKNTTILKEYD